MVAVRARSQEKKTAPGTAKCPGRFMFENQLQ